MKFFIKSLAFVGFLLILSVNASAQRPGDKRLGNLTLQTKVLKIYARQTEPQFVHFDIEIENTFTNHGEEPIIILQPYNEKDDDPLWYAGITLATKDNEITGEYPIYQSSALPSVCGCKLELDEKLDKRTPPPGLTRILNKNETWVWKTTIPFGLTAKGKNYYGNWEAINQLKSKITAYISYSMFPNNSRIGEKVKKRWENFGILYLAETHSTITSEPFELDLKNIEIQK